MEVNTSVPNEQTAPSMPRASVAERRRKLIQAITQKVAKTKQKPNQYCNRRTSKAQKCRGSPTQSEGVPCHTARDANTSAAAMNSGGTTALFTSLASISTHKQALQQCPS